MKEILPKKSNGCPYLFLAPMEGVGDRPFRQAMASIGGFDEACTEFMRVPSNAHVPSLARLYVPNITAPIPEAVQLMGSDPELMAEMAREIAKMGATRIDLNCGCPSNTVTGRGAGSSLLKDPEHLHQVAKAIVDAVSIPVTAKLRSGFEDTSLFKENLLAAQSSGIRFLTLHPRTKVDGYSPPAKWELIAEAKQILRIPVVGNGDILSVKDAVNMLNQTGCDALMVGRGSVINPFIFHEIKAHYSGVSYIPSWENFIVFINTFVKGLYPEMTLRGKVSKMKQLFSFLFRKSSSLLELRHTILRSDASSVEAFLELVLPLYRSEFEKL